MVRKRRGASTFGCLFMALLAIAAVYFGLKIGKVYWDASDYESEMKANAQGAEPPQPADTRRGPADTDGGRGSLSDRART